MKAEQEDLILGHLNHQISIIPSMSKRYTSEKFTRISFLKLKSKVEIFMNHDSEERLILMPGLRGVGKTTLMFQIYEHVKKIKDDVDILYLSCDILNKQLNSNLLEALKIYEDKIISDPFENINKKIFLLIDEVHYDDNWQIVIKSIFDRTKNIMMIVSGSCSIAMETNTDLTRRMHLERIYPLNFPEYLLLKKQIFPLSGATLEIKRAIFESGNLEEAYRRSSNIHDKLSKKKYPQIPKMESELESFLSKGGITSTLDIKKSEDTFRKINSVLDKIVYQDIVTFYPSCRNSVSFIIPILNVLANTTDKISYSKLKTLIHDVNSKSKIHEILRALNKAGVIQKIDIDGAPARMERNSSKYYFSSPSIKASLLWQIGKFNNSSDVMGNLLENAVFNTLEKIRIYQPNLIQSIHYGDNPGDPDFKIITPRGKMIIEVGWGKKSCKQVKEKGSKNFSVIISKEIIPRMDRENDVLYLPRELFLLMG